LNALKKNHFIMAEQKAATKLSMKEQEALARGPAPPNFFNDTPNWGLDHKAWVADDPNGITYCYVRNGNGGGEWHQCWPHPKPPKGMTEEDVTWNPELHCFFCLMPGFKMHGFGKKKRPAMKYQWTKDSNGVYDWRPYNTYDYGWSRSL